MAAGVEAVVAAGTEGGRARPVEAIGFLDVGLHLQQALQGAETEVAAGLGELHQARAAVAKRAGDGGLIAEGPGVGGRDQLVAQFRIPVGVELQEQQGGISPVEEIVLQQGADRAPFAIADVAVVAEAEIAPQRRGTGRFHTQADDGLGGVTAEAAHVALDVAHTTAAHLHQGPLHRGQVQHGADQGLQLLLNPGLEVFIAAAHLQFSDAAEHDIERAGAGVGEGVNAAVDVAVLDQPCGEQGCAAFEGGFNAGPAAVSEDRVELLGGVRVFALNRGAPKGGWATGACAVARSCWCLCRSSAFALSAKDPLRVGAFQGCRFRQPHRTWLQRRGNELGE